MILKFLKKLKFSLFQELTEIDYLRRAILRNEIEIERMQRSACNRGACCASCVYGYDYFKVSDKLDRQHERLRILLKRKNKHENRS